MAERTQKQKNLYAQLILLGFVTVCLLSVPLVPWVNAETDDPEVLAENSDLNGDGRIDFRDVHLLLNAWHGMYTPLPTSAIPTPTPTLAPAIDLEGFWVGDFTEYFSDVPGDAVHRTGQFLWYAKVNGTQMTATGDDRYYPVRVDANIEGDLLTGTLKSFTTFDMWAIASVPDSATTTLPEIEGWLWGSKDGFNYNTEFLLKKSNVRPTLVPTATFTQVPSRTVTPEVTPTIINTATPTFFPVFSD